MYQFTTTTVINSNLDSNRVLAKYVGDATSFKVTRVGDFLATDITSVYKRPYYAGAKEVAQVTVPVITAGLVARLDVDVRLAQQTESNYASTHLYFKKPITVEVIATGVANDDAAALAQEVTNLKINYGQADITATVSGAVITLNATTDNQRFFTVKVLKEDPDALTNSIVQPEFINVATGAVTLPGLVGFGDDNWMQRKIMIQTLENTRYFGINKEERPIIGGDYTQFTLAYLTVKEQANGISGGKDYSNTNHIFYVLDSLAADFEDELNNTVSVRGLYGASGGLVVTADVSTIGLTTSDMVALQANKSCTWASDDVSVTILDAGPGTVTVGQAAGVGTATITADDGAGNIVSIVFTVTS